MIDKASAIAHSRSISTKMTATDSRRRIPGCRRHCGGGGMQRAFSWRTNRRVPCRRLAGQIILGDGFGFTIGNIGNGKVQEGTSWVLRRLTDAGNEPGA